MPDLMNSRRMFLITSTSGGPGRLPVPAMELQVEEVLEVLEEEVVAVEDGTLELVAVKFQEPEAENL